MTSRRRIPAEELLRAIEPQLLRVRVRTADLLAGVDPERFRLRLPDELIRGWRVQLDDANEQVLRSVSRSMAGAVAAETLVRIPEITFPSMPGLGQIREQLEPYFAQRTRDLSAELQRFVQPAALAAATDFAARMQTYVADYRRYQEALWDMGWWIPPSMPMSFFVRVGRLAAEGKRVEVRHRMVDAGRSPSVMRMLESWMDLAAFRERRRFLLDGVRDLRTGRYRVSIPTLLPHLEGIAVDAFAPGSKSSSPLPILTASASLSSASMLGGDAIVETVTVLWSWQDFSATPATSRQLNRHLILHGRSTGYATAANGVRVLFALDQLASMVRRSTP